jgi:hypothetical protein
MGVKFDQTIEVTHEITYLGLTQKRSCGWKRQKFMAGAKGNQILMATDKCLARIHDILYKGEDFGECI